MRARTGNCLNIKLYEPAPAGESYLHKTSLAGQARTGNCLNIKLYEPAPESYLHKTSLAGQARTVNDYEFCRNPHLRVNHICIKHRSRGKLVQLIIMHFVGTRTCR